MTECACLHPLDFVLIINWFFLLWLKALSLHYPPQAHVWNVCCPASDVISRGYGIFRREASLAEWFSKGGPSKIIPSVIPIMLSVSLSSVM